MKKPDLLWDSSQAIFFAGKRPVPPSHFLRYVLIFFLFLLAEQTFAQNKRLVVIGSSTAAGVGASISDSCWVRRVSQYYKCQLGAVDSVYNLGVPGTSFYHAMPTGYIPPPARPNPDTLHNVTRALTILSDLANPADGTVIINYPTNGYNSYPISEILDGLQIIYDSVTFAGHHCYVTTTQPRGDAAFNSPVIKYKLSVIKDSILNRFGENNTVDFWTGMYEPSDTTILADYSCGDLIHFNNAGYSELFRRVQNKNIFHFPIWYSKPGGDLNDLSTWGSSPDGSGDSPLSFDTDFQTFYIVNNPAPTINASWLLMGKNTNVILGDGINPIDFIVPEGLEVKIIQIPNGTCN